MFCNIMHVQDFRVACRVGGVLFCASLLSLFGFLAIKIPHPPPVFVDCWFTAAQLPDGAGYDPLALLPDGAGYELPNPNISDPHRTQCTRNLSTMVQQICLPNRNCLAPPQSICAHHCRETGPFPGVKLTDLFSRSRPQQLRTKPLLLACPPG